MKSFYFGAGYTILMLASLAALLAAQAPSGNAITLLTLNQPPCTTLTPKSVIRAKLAYHLAEAEQSEYGFAVSIKFQSTDPRMTFSDGTLGVATITARHDTLTLSYPVAAIRRNDRLKRPVTCYFYLHRNTAPGRSVVLAQTEPIVFQECM
ncbi:hypothetical protein [Hymenobacter arizonensis]|uniref:Uncharacterized protein n=1 Tax=Hymenobacter arizonensis TaxID=1227077 RepID=A0A1I5WVP2_HYMAR|nr:hypothetical protein [Hymenobacter arizonensis]SFQ23586.1 hypothetical protein SAMN04515668_1506 [Hymenobacter arizonensis]